MFHLKHVPLIACNNSVIRTFQFLSKNICVQDASYLLLCISVWLQGTEDIFFTDRQETQDSLMSPSRVEDIFWTIHSSNHKAAGDGIYNILFSNKFSKLLTVA
jgi:hypothetical protein